MMTAVHLKPKDFFEDSRWAFILTGLARGRGAIFAIYAIFLISLYFSMLFLSIYKLFVVLDDLYYLIATMHFVACNIWVGLAIVAKHACNESLTKMREMISYGIYSYRNEELDEETVKIQEEVSRDFRAELNLFVYLYSFGFICVVFVSPLAEFLFFAEESRGVANPFLPHCFYLPFDTYTPQGFSAAYSLDLVFWLFSVAVIVNTFKLVLFGLTQHRLHLKVLNHSLTYVRKRALALYLKSFAVDKNQMASEDFYKSRDFNTCLHSCLRANIQHHQMILRFKKHCQPFLSGIFTGLFTTLTVILYACLIFLILQDKPVSSRLKFVCMLLGENLCSLLPCRFGEAVIQESERLFESTYNSDFLDYDRDSRQTLLILMACTRLPIRFRTKFLDGTACMDQYGKLVQAAYTLMNVMVAT